MLGIRRVDPKVVLLRKYGAPPDALDRQTGVAGFRTLLALGVSSPLRIPSPSLGCFEDKILSRSKDVSSFTIAVRFAVNMIERDKNTSGVDVGGDEGTVARGCPQELAQLRQLDKPVVKPRR